MLSYLKYDFYSKLPSDLTERTFYGNILSFLTIIILFLLFYYQFTSFLFINYYIITSIDSSPSSISSTLSSSPLSSLNSNSNSNNNNNYNKQFDINIDITLLDIPCIYSVIDLVDIVGTRIQNITFEINKYDVYKDGHLELFNGIHPEDIDILRESINHVNVEELLQRDPFALEINDNHFDQWITQHHHTFVNFYTSWCDWCEELQPTWEVLAEIVHERQYPISIIKVNCAENIILCENQKIRAFPTLRMFQAALPVKPDYLHDRTINAFIEYLDYILEFNHTQGSHYIIDDHLGCRIEGSFRLNRAPGNFRIEARSWTQILNPLMTNISHTINHLSFGTLLNSQQLSELSTISEDYFLHSSISPLDQRIFPLDELHRGYHHYIQAIPTIIELDENFKNSSEITTYQLIQSSQIMSYHEELIPAIVISYDISPISIRIKKKKKPWYDFITSLFAILGGTYTIFNIIANLLHLIPPKKIYIIVAD